MLFSAPALAQEVQVDLAPAQAVGSFGFGAQLTPLLTGRMGLTPWSDTLSRSARWSSVMRVSALERHVRALAQLSEAERGELRLEEQYPEAILSDFDRYVLRRTSALGSEVSIVEAFEEKLSLSHVWGHGPSGFLLNARRLEKSPFWLQRRFKDYGTPEMIVAIKAGVSTLRERFPNAPKLIIGDLSKRYGGHFPPHLSHQSGQDADIGYFIKGPYAHQLKGLTMVNRRTIDVAKTWAFLSGMLKSGLVETAFIDYQLQAVLYRHALSEGEWTREELDAVFSYPLWKGKAISHLKGHSDHMHVRFRAPLSSQMAQSYIRLYGRSALRPRRRYAHPKKGETLVRMAKRHRVGWKSMMHWNHLSLRQARAPLGKGKLIVGYYTPYAARQIKFPDVLTRDRRLLKSAVSQQAR